MGHCHSTVPESSWGLTKISTVRCGSKVLSIKPAAEWTVVATGIVVFDIVS